jgi:hypothetical protein
MRQTGRARFLCDLSVAPLRMSCTPMRTVGRRSHCPRPGRASLPEAAWHWSVWSMKPTGSRLRLRGPRVIRTVAALKSRSRAAFWAFPAHPSAMLYLYFRRRGEAGATAGAFGGRSHRRIVAHRVLKPKRLPTLSNTVRIRHVDVNYENVLRGAVEWRSSGRLQRAKNAEAESRKHQSGKDCRKDDPVRQPPIK